MHIRLARPEDLAAVTALEAVCFPAAEAATEESFRSRLAHYASHFWLLEDGDTLVSFVNGLVTNERDLTDEMYENAAMHDENGAWQMIFGVVTHPDYQRRGCAEKLLRYVVEQAARRVGAGWCSPARSGWCIFTRRSASSTRGSPSPPTAAWCGTKCV